MSNEPLRKESEEDVERPRDPDEGDIGVDKVLRKLDKSYAELRLNALDHSHRLASAAPTPGLREEMSNEPLRKESEEDVERPRDPDEGDIGVDKVLRKLDKSYAELRLNALDHSHRLASAAPTPGLREEMSNEPLRKESEEDVERPRDPDEGDIGVDKVLRKLDKSYAELRLNALDHSHRLASAAPTPGIREEMSNEPLRKESEEDVERPRDPDEGDIGVDKVLRKLDKSYAELRLNALDHSHRLASAAPTPGISNWIQIGPLAAPNGQALFGNGILVTGRITSMAVDPTDARIIYIGAAQGGVWKTIDGGNTWNPTSDNERSIAIGALAIDPANHLLLYAGTGEANFSADSYYGAGILKTTNGGDTWTLVSNSWYDPSVPTGGTFTGSNFARIAINPVTTTTIFAASGSGLFRSTDRGFSTWIKMSNGTPQASATDVIINPANTDIVYAAFSNNGIYQTTNANATTPAWNKLTSGLPATSGFRTRLSISPSSPQVVYALMSDSGGHFVNQFYNTTDGGNTWNSIALPGGNIGRQGFYNLNLAVDP